MGILTQSGFYLWTDIKKREDGFFFIIQYIFHWVKRVVSTFMLFKIVHEIITALSSRFICRDVYHMNELLSPTRTTTEQFDTAPELKGPSTCSLRLYKRRKRRLDTGIATSFCALVYVISPRAGNVRMGTNRHVFSSSSFSWVLFLPAPVFDGKIQ